MVKIKRWTIAAASCLVLCAAVFGAILGLMLSSTRFIIHTEHFSEFNTALPTRLLDINGEVITEFASDEKREMITLDQLPQHVIDALITREDQQFYSHNGFSLKALLRAVVGVLSGRSLGGGSTITQQIAGTLYADRADISVSRKLKELWWAIQMERRYAKNEILELYLNKIYLGGGTYGVNAASKYYFGHSASELTPAEAAILVIQLSNPAYYNPFEYPNRAMDRQQEVLRQMVSSGFISVPEAVASFDEYWLNFDYTRINTSAFFMRDDKAPWFSEYVLRELSSMIYGNLDIYTGGFTVNTTMNLKHQTAAQDIMAERIAYANRTYRSSTGVRKNAAVSMYIPLTELLSLTFNIPQLHVTEERTELLALASFDKEINPVLDLMSLMFGMENIKIGVVNRANAKVKQDTGKTTIEGTLLALENETGYITALVGGSKFGPDNQFIRATQAKLQPGSTFKPLYYSAAIDSGKFTPATIIYDTPVVFYTADGRPYLPQNFLGEFFGPVQFWYALAKSMNIPSLKVLDAIGFDAAIARTTSLLGIPQQEAASRGFLPVYPMGLGTVSVRPIELARAFAVFGNQGKAVDPIAIRSVKDRNGKVFLDPEQELRLEQRKRGSDIQIISPQNAFIMSDILKNSVQLGTLRYATNTGAKLRYKDENGKTYQMPAAGKTGTTQNWADAWAVGYTPYLTAVVWLGFDSVGQSLGLESTGSTLAGPAWGDFMQIANQDYPLKEFIVPNTGLIRASVCRVSGLILTPDCGNRVTTQYFLEGTQPKAVCDYHPNRTSARDVGIDRLQTEKNRAGVSPIIINDSSEPLKVDLSFMDDVLSSQTKDSPLGVEPEVLTEKPAATHNFLLD